MYLYVVTKYREIKSMYKFAFYFHFVYFINHLFEGEDFDGIDNHIYAQQTGGKQFPHFGKSDGGDLISVLLPTFTTALIPKCIYENCFKCDFI